MVGRLRKRVSENGGHSVLSTHITVSWVLSGAIFKGCYFASAGCCSGHHECCRSQ